MKTFFFICLLLIPCFLFSQNKTHAVYLIGDAGEFTKPGDALVMLKEELLLNPNSSVLFLGDNVYPKGLNIVDTNSILRLKSQLQILKAYQGNVFFIPGNHDWDAQKADGLHKVIAQQNYITTFIKDSTTALNKNGRSFLPENGLPGPCSIKIDDGLQLICIDTQWLLHFHKKNKIGSIKKTKAQFYNTLDSLLIFSKLANESVIIAAHHPLYTNGNHSLKKQPFRFLINYTPLKILGWMGIDRLLSQDIDNPSYKKMRKQLLTLFIKYDNITYVSGHDHNLQYFKYNSNKFIVSGSGSKLSKLRKKKRFESLYQSDQKTGFVKITLADKQNQLVEIYQVGEQPFLVK